MLSVCAFFFTNTKSFAAKIPIKLMLPLFIYQFVAKIPIKLMLPFYIYLFVAKIQMKLLLPFYTVAFLQYDPLKSRLCTSQWKYEALKQQKNLKRFWIPFSCRLAERITKILRKLKSNGGILSYHLDRKANPAHLEAYFGPNQFCLLKAIVGFYFP